jgi:formylglycine-generating enzyme required for sulfatase activity
MSNSWQTAVVLITNSDPAIRDFGTGFVIHKDEQATYFLTCEHVVRAVGGVDKKIEILDTQAKIIASSPEDSADLAILCVEKLLDIPSLPLCLTSEKGEPFSTAGFQRHGSQIMIRDLQGTLRKQVGIYIKGQQNRINAWDLEITDKDSLQSGYSGSPIVNEHNHVIGVINTKRGEGKTGVAIFIEALQKIWPEMPPGLFVRSLRSERSRNSIELPPLLQPEGSRNPYPGLLPFRSDRAQHFHGRDIERTELVNLISNDHKRLILMFGASGAGKSSLVEAGVIPELKKIAWETIICRPGKNAFDSLANAICKQVDNLEDCLELQFQISRGELGLQLSKHPALIKDVLRLAVEEKGWQQSNGILLFVDQFEELFSLTPVGSDLPQTFMSMIEYIVRAEEELPNMHLIFTLRGEYLEQLLANRWDRLITPFLLGLPSQTALRQMVEKPIEEAGLVFDNPRLPQLIVEEIEKETSALVLISFIMKQLYDRCEASGLLTDKVYNDLGGVKGAIPELGNKYLQDHKDNAEPILEVFSRLIQFDPVRNTTTRRPVPLKDFSSRALDVINDLSKLSYRLLTIRRSDSDYDENRRTRQGTMENIEREVQHGVPVVEIAHEALIRNWAFLKEIADKNEAFYRSEAELKQLINLVKRGSVKGKPSDLNRYLTLLEEQVNPDLHKNYAENVKILVDAIFAGLEKEFGLISTEPDRRKDIGREFAEIVEKLRQTDITPPMQSGVHLLSNNLPDISWISIESGTIKIKTRVGEGIQFDVQAFEIALHPITVWQYHAFLEADDGYKDKGHRWWKWKGQSNTDYWKPKEMHSMKQGNCPVTGVFWYNAVAFCNWLTWKYRQMGLLDDEYVIRLPTEWEWQCAALGPETQDTLPYKYPWGTDWKQNGANTSECSLLEEIAVGMFSPFKSRSGAEDMFGNVAEWCLNSFESPKEMLLTDEQRRVLRGASYRIQGETNSTFDWRFGLPSGKSEKWAGFRVVKALPVQF